MLVHVPFPLTHLAEAKIRNLQCVKSKTKSVIHQHRVHKQQLSEFPSEMPHDVAPTLITWQPW